MSGDWKTNRRIEEDMGSSGDLSVRLYCRWSPWDPYSESYGFKQKAETVWSEIQEQEA